jgi:hypothetical protein
MNLQEVRGRLAQLDPNSRDHLAEIQSLKTMENELVKQALTEQAIEEKVQEDIAFSISGVDLSELPPEMIVVVEMIVKADRRKIYAEHALELEQIEDERDAYKAEAELKISNQDKALEALRQDYETCARELNEQEAETIRLVQERDDFKKKLANASATIAEKDLEIKRLNSQIDEYQVAKVYGEREKQRIIDVNEDEASSINNAIAKVKESWEEKANRALARWDLPSITPPAIEEVQPFRDEDPTTEPDSNQLPATQETEVSQFQEETGHGLVVPTSGVEETVSRQEHEALRHEVTMLAVELKARGILPHNWEAA